MSENENQDPRNTSKPGGPLAIPPLRENVSRQTIERLGGHTTSPDWLPAGVWTELDELREDHLRLRHQVAADLGALRKLAGRFAAEDAEQADALRNAHRSGSPRTESNVTPEAERAAERTLLEQRLKAGLEVLAEKVDEIVEAFRQHEDEWLDDLHRGLTPAREKRRYAETLLAEAQAEEFRLFTLGRWVQSTADDDGFGQQPAPGVVAPPQRVSPEVFKDAFDRPWHKRKPWNRAVSRSAP